MVVVGPDPAVGFSGAGRPRAICVPFRTTLNVYYSLNFTCSDGDITLHGKFSSLWSS